MDIELYAAFVLASVLLIVVPGPNVGLIVANSLAHGPRHALVTVAGTTVAMSIQLAITCAGLASLMAILAQGFEWLRWIGVAYLSYLGIKHWRSFAAVRGTEATRETSRRKLFWQGFLVALTNPKTLLFYAAFLPQFVDPALAPGPQIAVLCVTFVSLALVFDSGYALLAARARGYLLEPRRVRWLGRIAGSFLIGAGIGLALARRS